MMVLIFSATAFAKSNSSSSSSLVETNCKPGKTNLEKPTGEIVPSQVENKPDPEKPTGEVIPSQVEMKPDPQKPNGPTAMTQVEHNDCVWVTIWVPGFLSTAGNIMMLPIKYQVCGDNPPPQF